MNNPRFHLSNGCNPSFPQQGESCLNDMSAQPASHQPSYRTGELWSLIEKMLNPIVVSLGATGGIVRVLSPDSQTLQIAGATGLPMEVCEDESVVDIACGVCGKALCDRNVHASEAAICAQRPSRHFSDAGYSYVVAAPLEYRGELAGILTLFFPSPDKVPDNFSLKMAPFAELVGIALEHGKKNLEEKRSQLIAERQAMANEIHDSLAHTLYYGRMRMSLLLDAIRRQDNVLAEKYAGEINEALGSGQKTMREIITHFRCQMNPLGLQYALQALVDEFRERASTILTFKNRVATFELPVEHELQVFHIVREALANISAHSAATHAELAIESRDGRYVFVITDNGDGYDGPPSEGHYGLMIMRERALRINGEVEIHSAEGSGTRVQLSFPVPDTSAE